MSSKYRFQSIKLCIYVQQFSDKFPRAQFVFWGGGEKDYCPLTLPGYNATNLKCALFLLFVADLDGRTDDMGPG